MTDGNVHWRVRDKRLMYWINLVHPVGSIWETTTTDDPNTLWPGTKWDKMDGGRVLVSAGTYTESGTTYTYNLGDTGGEAKHQLSTGELASHNHNVSVSVSINSAGNHSHTVSFTGVTNDGTSRNWAQFRTDEIYNKEYNDSHVYQLSATSSSAGDHSHSASASASVGNTGGNTAHENRMPYQVVHRWNRIA